MNNAVRNFNESPYFRFIIPVGLEIGQAKLYRKYFKETSSPESQFLPFNLIEILNMSDQLVRLKLLDSDIEKWVAGGQSMEVTDIKFVGFEVENIDPINPTDGKIEIVIKRELTLRETLIMLLEK